jgi:hypothetical protein
LRTKKSTHIHRKKKEEEEDYITEMANIPLKWQNKYFSVHFRHRIVVIGTSLPHVHKKERKENTGMTNVINLISLLYLDEMMFICLEE